MSPLDSIDAVAEINDTGGRAGGGRRLSDKILAAFNHAYAVGDTEVASKLKAALVAVSETRAESGASRREQRAPYDPVGQADLWIAFVDARNQYKQLNETADGEAEAVAAALKAMKDAYKAWSTR